MENLAVSKHQWWLTFWIVCILFEKFLNWNHYWLINKSAAKTSGQKYGKSWDMKVYLSNEVEMIVAKGEISHD